MRLLMLLCLALIAAPAWAQSDRVALVIANAAYAHTPRLDNPPNDADAMAALLTERGFDVTRVNDADEDAMVDAIEAFGRKAARARIAAAFYSGHGMELEGDNYLIPVDATLATSFRGRRESIKLGALRAMAGHASEMSLVIIDACRNNAFPADNRSGTRGMTRARRRPGEILAFSTAPGTVAADGDGDLSPYTAVLIERLRAAPNEDLRILFTELKLNNNQHPEVLTGHFPRGFSAVLDAPQPEATAAALNTPQPTQTPIAPTAPVRPPRQEVAAAPLPNIQRIVIVPMRRRAAAPAPPRAEIPEPLPPPRAAAPEPSQEPPIIHVFRDFPAAPEMIVIPGGFFWMGSPEGEGDPDEHPQTHVKIAPFALGKYEVTFDEYDACANAGICRPIPQGGAQEGNGDEGWGRGDRPVISVNMEDVDSYIWWLNSQVDGTPYRLPSEAEWEYAARAGTTTPYPWGDYLSHAYANYGEEECCGGATSDSDHWTHTAPVGSFPPNSFGLHDMIGNVWEWTNDCWSSSYTGRPVNETPWRTGDCTRHMIRGGAWSSAPKHLRTAYRSRMRRHFKGSSFGFRVARALP